MDNEPPQSSPVDGQSTQNTNPSTPSNTRRSGRATRKPELFSQGTYSDTTPRTKRKHPDTDGEEEGAEGEEEDASQSETDNNAGDEDADEEEVRERKRAARKTSGKKSAAGSRGQANNKQPRATKKPRVAESNGVAAGGDQQLAIRPATTNGQRKPATASRSRKPKVRPSLAAGESGLYGGQFLSLLYIYMCV